MAQKAQNFAIAAYSFFNPYRPRGRDRLSVDGQLTERGRLILKSVRALIGMPAVLAETGLRIGRVTRVFLDDSLQRVSGVWVSEKRGRLRFIPAREISMIGEVAIFVHSIGDRRGEGGPMRIRRALNGAGMLIGAVAGAYLNEETLKIDALEVSLGFWEDIARGRQLVRDFAVRLPEGDVTVIGEGETEDEVGTD